MSMRIPYTNLNTATSPVTPARAIAPEPLNFADDFRIVTASPTEIVLSNIKADLTQPETIRIAFSEIPDIYKNTRLEQAGSAMDTNGAMKRGCSVLVQMSGVGIDNDSESAFPYSAHMVLRIPYGPTPSAGDIKVMIARLLGALYETGDADSDDRINALIRGAIVPNDL